ncbi:low molecular weight phosphotyrosine protein phosphatase [Enterovibrio sp. ZSDZ35]|uniref:protein-tyrosine-phosphatase n=1 Tax=Enterovibrio qingdaonensis TaxID=2899818 RepID=A0ABT5QPC7_9GAMM|nr:low molecular weight phosphotyrosine protein phosphatase [Enterovibrio sp. ZSDZ35]MDD1782459.1 low molecular weight phosphotyrosine protein phosphatase [Enterovibrio sp. ZSDZ35]
MFQKILVVCVGNICRSPTGEYLLKNLLPNKQVDSAGIASEISKLVGKPADSMATTVAAEHGIDLTPHGSRQLTEAMAAEYDLILVMEKGHIDAVCSIAPAARGKTMLFGQWVGQKEIPDPYRQSREAFDFAWSILEESAAAWAKKL